MQGAPSACTPHIQPFYPRLAGRMPEKHVSSWPAVVADRLGPTRETAQKPGRSLRGRVMCGPFPAQKECDSNPGSFCDRRPTPSVRDSHDRLTAAVSTSVAGDALASIKGSKRQVPPVIYKARGRIRLSALTGGLLNIIAASNRLALVYNERWWSRLSCAVEHDVRCYSTLPAEHYHRLPACRGHCNAMVSARAGLLDVGRLTYHCVACTGARALRRYTTFTDTQTTGSISKRW